MHFIFNLCPIYPHDGASAKFSTNSQETDYRVAYASCIFVKDVLFGGGFSFFVHFLIILKAFCEIFLAILFYFRLLSLLTLI